MMRQQTQEFVFQQPRNVLRYRRACEPEGTSIGYVFEHGCDLDVAPPS